VNEHQRFRALAAAALDFDSTPAEARLLADHVTACIACRRYEAALRADDVLARSRRRTHAPEAIRLALVAEIERPASRYVRDWLVPAAGAALVAIALLLAWGLALRLTPANVAHPARLTWSPLGDTSPFGNGTVADVAASGSRLTAVGSISVNGGGRVGAIWTSTDGRSWTKASDDSAFRDAVLLAVAFHGTTTVVLGEHWVSGGGWSDVWVSPGWLACNPCTASQPAVAWMTPATSFFAGVGSAQTYYNAIAAGKPGFVIAGTAWTVDTYGGSIVGAGASSSADGSTWTSEAPTSAALVGGTMGGVAAGREGFVAVGDIGLAPTVWTSQTGQSWQRLQPASMSATASIRDVAAGPGEYVAVGDDGGDAEAWVSADGQTWQPAPRSSDLAGARMMHVAWLGHEFVATGQTSAGDGIAWASTDGQSWIRLDTGAIFAGSPIQTAAAIDTRVVLFGADASGRLVAAVGDPSSQP
jgi:hypothetical protein